MKENEKKDLRNAGPEQLAGLLKDLLDLDDPAPSNPFNQHRTSQDATNPSDALETDGE
jgi:hypothetical protein